MKKNELIEYGKSLIGKTAQSKLLTEISPKGNRVLQSPQEITGFEVVTCFQESELMVCIGGELVYESTLINIS